MSNPKVFRVALLGCGRIAQVHAGYLRATPHAELVGGCDADPEAREAFTRRWQVPTCADIREMLGALEPDVVHVLTPPRTHAALAIELLRAGVHVLVEKPMALSVEEADRMVAVARETGRVLTVDHNRWFDPVMQSAREVLSSGGLGELVGAEVFCSVPAGEGEEQAWKSNLPGGPLFDSAPHPLYLARGLVGEIGEIRALAVRDGRGGLQEVRAVLGGERAPCLLSLSTRAQPFVNTVTLLGSKATAVVNLNHMTLVVRRVPKLPKLLAKVFPSLDEARQLIFATARNAIDFVLGRQRFYPGIGAHFVELYRALAEGREVPVSAEDGRAVVALLDRLYRVVQQGYRTEVAA